MTRKTYQVTLQTPAGDTRTVTVPSPTGVQAGDAARPLMADGEAILTITELPGDDTRDLDGGPPRTQAEEAAGVTPGAAAVNVDAPSRTSTGG